VRRRLPGSSQPLRSSSSPLSTQAKLNRRRKLRLLKRLKVKVLVRVKPKLRVKLKMKVKVRLEMLMGMEGMEVKLRLRVSWKRNPMRRPPPHPRRREDTD